MSTVKNQYTPTTSSSSAGIFDERILSFFTTFYAASDNPSSIEEWATEYFTHDAHVTMGSKVAHGYDEILALRKANWAGPVKTRNHVIDQIYPFGTGAKDGLDVFLNGSVDYGLKNGKTVALEWAGKAVFVQDPNAKHGIKFAFYHVYLVSPYFLIMKTSWVVLGGWRMIVIVVMVVFLIGCLLISSIAGFCSLGRCGSVMKRTQRLL